MGNLPTLGDVLVDRTEQEIIGERAQYLTTKRILRRCLPQLRDTVNTLASPEAGYMAFPYVKGRLVVFSTHKIGAIAEMLEWPDPVKDVASEDRADRALLWSVLAQLIYQKNVDGAFAALATRLGTDGIAQFEESLSRLDNSVPPVDTLVPGYQLVTRGALFVFAGQIDRNAAGTVGALAVPMLIKPEIMIDNFELGDWNADGNHRWLH